MSRRRGRASPETDMHDFLSVSSNDNRFGAIHEGMLKSKRWQELSPTARNLFVVAVTHSQTADNYMALFSYRQSEGIGDSGLPGNGYFILTEKYLEVYGFTGKHASRYFTELIEAGFMECVHNNRHRKKANLYRLSKKWKDAD